MQCCQLLTLTLEAIVLRQVTVKLIRKWKHYSECTLIRSSKRGTKSNWNFQEKGNYHCNRFLVHNWSGS